MPARSLRFARSVIDGLLTYARTQHPREGILLLRGKVSKHEIRVTDLVIPPLATHGTDFSSFPTWMLPADLSILGVAHSHPTGALHPSLEDLHNFFGRVMVIVGYPYATDADVAVFDRDGNGIRYSIEG